RIHPGGVARLLEILHAGPKVAAAGPWHCHDHQHKRSMNAGTIWKPRRIHYQPETIYSTEVVLGAAMLMRMSALRQVGFFDPEIFLYYEEDELCQRLRRGGGELRVSSGVLMEHRAGSSSTPSRGIEGMKQQHFAWSRLHVEQKAFGTASAQRLA